MNSCKRAEPAFPVLAVSRPFLCDVHLHFNTDMSIAIRYPGFLTGKKTERAALPERCFLSFTNRRFWVGYSELFFIRYLYNLRHNHFQHILKSVKVVHLDSAVLSLMAAWCDFYLSDQSLASSLLQFPPHDGPPCSWLYTSHYQSVLRTFTD